jgi:hypothetical protein
MSAYIRQQRRAKGRCVKCGKKSGGFYECSIHRAEDAKRRRTATGTTPMPPKKRWTKDYFINPPRVLGKNDVSRWLGLQPSSPEWASYQAQLAAENRPTYETRGTGTNYGG